ncbi:MAG TPA: hypothetical protein VJJ76_00335 [archaeon]|nr:hypothetical protein [archaeon]
MRVITELEKTILIAFAVVSKGTGNFIHQDDIILQFSRRQRKMVEMFIKKLAKDRFLDKKYNTYRLSDMGKKVVARLLSEGASLWMPKR